MTNSFFPRIRASQKSFFAFALMLGSLALPMRAATLDYIEVGAMYMAYFGFNTGTGVISWTNPGDYAFDGPQVLRPLSVTHPGDYYVGSEPWVDLLNPQSEDGQDAASSRLFGFSLSGEFRNYLTSNGYAVAIHLNSITFVDSGLEAMNTSVFYYNRGNDDWGTYNADKVAWNELGSSNYLIWNGLSFSNMVHPLVVTTDTFATNYRLSYTLSIVQDTTGANVNAQVVNSVTPVGGITPLTFSYDAQSLPIPEPSVSMLLLLGVLLVMPRMRKPLQRAGA